MNTDSETLSPLSSEEAKVNRLKLVCALAELICIVSKPTVSAKDVIAKGAEVILLIHRRWPNIEAEPLEPPFNILETLAWASGSLIEEVLSLRKEKEARKTGAFVQDVIACFALLNGQVLELRNEMERILLEEKLDQLLAELCKSTPAKEKA